MYEIKVSLSIALQGSVMFNKEECLKTAQKVIEKKTKTGKVYKKTVEAQVEDWNKIDKHTIQVIDSNGTISKTITFHTRKTKPATQTINICKEAYNYMTSKECPEWSKTMVWTQMNFKQRLESHLRRIAEHLGGTIISYKIFED